ncbi:Acetyltransferase (GNAT) family protein [Micromonospora rhizosphaerae]|uniref:Acetyltransferase (GNAT) family protein n=2 Tax=Micromonospora rhizosphaerae TaxID=568872 RepID=A0A1C6RKY0_9ACTN|nr:Acetyltransferase (GNAT) family protein [Micromonospora rhizosphaerae]
MPRIELGATLRALRRAADLSQRELAEKSGVPQATIARIESGKTSDPNFRTVERLVGAVAGRITIAVAGHTSQAAADATCSLPAVPHEKVRDAAGRHCPAHLDAREVRQPWDWPGAWWARWYDLPPERWRVPLPAATYVRDRGERDRRRRGERVRREVRIRRYTGDGLPSTSWRFVAELPDSELVGELRAHERGVDLLLGHDVGGGREIVLDGVLVAGAYRQLGIGRRLVEALSAEMDRAGVTTAHAVAEFGGIGFLIACGYRLQASRPAALRLDRRAGAAPRLDPPVSAAPQQPR